MKEYKSSSERRDFRFSVEEIAGAFGDYGTIVPLLLGVAIVSRLNFGHMLLFLGVWYIITGVYYRAPIPVEPMKAIGAVAIAEGLRQGEIVASGIVLGILFLLLGSCRAMKFLQEKVPESVTRGIQLGLALLLVRTSIGFVARDTTFAVVSLSIIVLFFIARRFLKVPDVSALFVLLVGVVSGLLLSGVPSVSIISLPRIVVPATKDFLRGCWLLAIPQVPLTIANAILATSLLMRDLFERNVDPDRLSKTIGLMNLTSVILGGFPMCHGAGGLAAHYRFGARTGGASIVAGFVLLPIALFFASPQFVAIIPSGVFGALLVFVAIELGKQSWKTESYPVTVLVAVVALIIHITIAFLVGMLLAFLLATLRKR